MDRLSITPYAIHMQCLGAAVCSCVYPLGSARTSENSQSNPLLSTSAVSPKPCSFYDMSFDMF